MAASRNASSWILLIAAAASLLVAWWPAFAQRHPRTGKEVQRTVDGGTDFPDRLQEP